MKTFRLTMFSNWKPFLGHATTSCFPQSIKIVVRGAPSSFCGTRPLGKESNLVVPRHSHMHNVRKWTTAARWYQWHLLQLGLKPSVGTPPSREGFPRPHVAFLSSSPSLTYQPHVTVERYMVVSSNWVALRSTVVLLTIAAADCACCLLFRLTLCNHSASEYQHSNNMQNFVQLEKKI